MRRRFETISLISSRPEIDPVLSAIARAGNKNVQEDSSLRSE
jgi:hypothetical protein